MSRALALLLPLALCGCATADQLAGGTPLGRWAYTRDYNAVSECLVRTLNFEFQPKDGFETVFGRSIAHQIQIIEPGQTNQVIHEHIGPGTAWLFRVQNEGQNRASATAFNFGNPNGAIPDQLRRAASNCDGRPV
jgi:hypothetical protein